MATQLYLTPRAIALPAYPPHPDSPVCLFTQCAASQAAVGQNTLLLDRATESRSNCSGWTTALWYWTLNFKACNNFFPPHLAYLSFTMPVHRYTEHCYWLINRQRERMLSFKGWFQFIATCALFFYRFGNNLYWYSPKKHINIATNKYHQARNKMLDDQTWCKHGKRQADLLTVHPKKQLVEMIHNIKLYQRHLQETLRSVRLSDMVIVKQGPVLPCFCLHLVRAWIVSYQSLVCYYTI